METPELLHGLNPAQRQAVEHTDGPLVVFAGAGSGKTRVITTRVARLIADGVPPWQILAVTFTNKAAGEMRARIKSLASPGSRVHVATFHASCARWLREFAGELGFDSNFAIYDDKDSTALLKRLLKEQCQKSELASRVGQIKNFIQWAKTRALLPSEIQISDYQAQKLPPGV